LFGCSIEISGSVEDEGGIGEAPVSATILLAEAVDYRFGPLAIALSQLENCAAAEAAFNSCTVEIAGTIQHKFR
jgi:hypothetical protein